LWQQGTQQEAIGAVPRTSARVPERKVARRNLGDLQLRQDRRRTVGARPRSQSATAPRCATSTATATSTCVANTTERPGRGLGEPRPTTATVVHSCGCVGRGEQPPRRSARAPSATLAGGRALVRELSGRRAGTCRPASRIEHFGLGAATARVELRRARGRAGAVQQLDDVPADCC
jgi:hypothetical protein